MKISPPASGNVFADLELPNAEELHTKTKLTLLIKRLIKQRGWTQQQAADALGIKQPDVSELSRGQPARALFGRAADAPSGQARAEGDNYCQQC